MNNPNGNASTDGVLTVTLENEPILNGTSALDSKSAIKNRASGSVSSATAYSNSTFVKK